MSLIGRGVSRDGCTADRRLKGKDDTEEGIREGDFPPDSELTSFWEMRNSWRRAS